MDAITTPSLTIVSHNQHIFKWVEVAESFGVPTPNQDVENAVRVVNYISPGFPECEVSVDNESRVMLLKHGAPTLAELVLLDKYILEAGLEIGGRRLKIRHKNPLYTVHADGFTIYLAGWGAGFGFPLEATIVAWADMDDPNSHAEDCEQITEDGMCHCDPVVDYRKYQAMAASNWEVILPKFLDRRWTHAGDTPTSIWTRDNSGPIIGGRVYD